MIRYNVVTMKKALRDFDKITGYLSCFYENTPKKFLLEFDKKKEPLAFSPEMYAVYHANPEYRCFIVGEYLAFYKIDEARRAVKIYRVCHSSRDTSRLFK